MKYRIILLFCLFSLLLSFSPCFGASQHNLLGVLARKNVGAGGCDDCSGDLKFSTHFENVAVGTGTPCGCSDGDATGSLTGASISDTQKYDGTYSLSCPADQDYIEFDVAANDIIAEAEGKVKFRVYIDTFVDTGRLFQAYGGANDKLRIYMNGNAGAIDIYAYYYHDGTADNLTLNCNRTEDSWFYIEYQWKQGVEGNDHKLIVCDSDGESNCSTIEEDDDLAALGTAFNTLYIGNNTDAASAVYIDKVEIYGDSDY